MRRRRYQCSHHVIINAAASSLSIILCRLMSMALSATIPQASGLKSSNGLSARICLSSLWALPSRWVPAPEYRLERVVG